MSDLKLMPEHRMDHLMKVAEECIGLISIDVEPNAALKKLATDNFLTDKEVELVSHAVNNSRQLAQFQQADAENRDKPFPLTNAKIVNERRYGTPGEMSADAKQTQDQPDAVGIADNVKKMASYSESVDYRLRISPTLDALAIREQLGVVSPPKVASVTLSSVHPSQAFLVGIDEARTRAAQSTDAAAGIIRKVASVFQKIVAPDFADFEKVAAAEGVCDELVQMVYDDGNLSKYGAQRMKESVKTARIYTTSEIVNLVDLLKQAQEHIDDAANALAAKTVLETHRKTALGKLASLFESNIQVGPQGLSQEFEKAPGSFLGMGEDPNKAIMDIAGESKPEGYAPEASLSHDVSQELKNVDAQEQIQKLLDDPYIKGYDLPDIIDAFNAARSVNPTFGTAQLTSYVRQHLATGGGIPLELQARASRRSGEEE